MNQTRRSEHDLLHRIQDGPKGGDKTSWHICRLVQLLSGALWTATAHISSIKKNIKWLSKGNRNTHLCFTWAGKEKLTVYQKYPSTLLSLCNCEHLHKTRKLFPVNNKDSEIFHDIIMKIPKNVKQAMMLRKVETVRCCSNLGNSVAGNSRKRGVKKAMYFGISVKHTHKGIFTKGKSPIIFTHLKWTKLLRRRDSTTSFA